MKDEVEYVFHSEADLLDRLSDGVQQSGREIVFVVGAPLTFTGTGKPGVPDVDGVIELIRSHFAADPKKLSQLDARLSGSTNCYQEAFSFLQARRGQDGANRIVRQAVWGARRGQDIENAGLTEKLARLTDAQLETFEDDHQGWHLSSAVEALGGLAAGWPQTFGKAIITSNFDPMIEISIRAAGGKAWRTAMHVDGSLGLSRAEGCEVIHIHGYWRGSDTLHTGNQLLQRRPNLRTTLINLLIGKTVVVMAYGGWDDILMQALAGLVADPGAFPEIVWAFRDENPRIGARLLSILQPGYDRNRVAFYAGVDCHTFLPKLFEEWRAKFSPGSIEPAPQSLLPMRPAILAKLDCDRPPSIDAWVGRSEELGILALPSSRFVAVCGIGGQGKSLLAARHIAAVSSGSTDFDRWDWRDCREEGDRLKSQIIAAIERVSGGQIVAADLTEATEGDLVEVFIEQASTSRAIFVFDNVDHYVDLEREKLVGLLDTLVKSFCRTATSSQLIVTCRPTVRYEAASAVTLVMKGLEPEEASELFAQRLTGRTENHADIVRAHQITNGHPFWLDLMAAHVARSSDRSLSALLEDVRRGRGDAPDVLSPIWEGLPDREKFVLRAMAEAVRPETEETIQRFVESELNFQKFKRALRSLISLNLVVVKTEINSPDLYDLHPLVRQFVRLNLARSERVSVIMILLNHYEGMIKSVAEMLGVHMPYSLLERWPQRAELEIEAGLIDKAFVTLQQAYSPLSGSGHNEEYIRVTRRLFENLDWTRAPEIGHFDEVLSDYVNELDDSGQRDDADDLMHRYEQTIPAKTVRYIKYCDIRCHSHWTRGEYDLAIEWGKRGDDLKSKSHVDTYFDCSHNLALSLRDGGDPEAAMPLFLHSKTLDELFMETEHDEVNATQHGNVGRCLFKLGCLKDALKCLRVSAMVLEEDDSTWRLSNQAYAREWIADVLESVKDIANARAFLVSAEDILARSLPVRARRYRGRIDELASRLPMIEPSPHEAHRIVRRWLSQDKAAHFVDDSLAISSSQCSG